MTQERKNPEKWMTNDQRKKKERKKERILKNE